MIHYDQSLPFALLLAAIVIYVLGTFDVTVFGNVPLNDTLDRFELETATLEETALQRVNLECRWKI